MNQNIKTQTLIFVLTLTLSPGLIMADPSSWTKERTYFERSIHKLGFGLTNVVKGGAEPYVHMLKASESESESTWTGFIRGTAYGTADILGGAFHSLTFFLPVDIPLPEGGAHGSEPSPGFPT